MLAARASTIPGKVHMLRPAVAHSAQAAQEPLRAHDVTDPTVATQITSVGHAIMYLLPEPLFGAWLPSIAQSLADTLYPLETSCFLSTEPIDTAFRYIRHIEVEMKNKTTTLTLRVSETWRESLEQLAEDLKLDPKRDRSRIIRDLVSRESRTWKEAPYVSLKTSGLVYATARRTLLYWIKQDLILVNDREKIPCKISIKPDRKEHFEQSGNEERKDHWLINYFSIFRDGKLIVQDTDRAGVTTKFVDLPINTPQDTMVRREILCAASGYVEEEKANERYDDRTDFPIDIPTLELDLRIAVDSDVYAVDQQRQHAGVDFELRNREHAKLSGLIDRNLIWNRGRHPSPAIKPRTSYLKLLESSRESLGQLINRVSELADKGQVASSDQKPLVNNKEKRAELLRVAMPESFLFGRLRWSMPQQNLVVCLAWNKPVL